MRKQPTKLVWAGVDDDAQLGAAAGAGRLLVTVRRCRPFTPLRFWQESLAGRRENFCRWRGDYSGKMRISSVNPQICAAVVRYDGENLRNVGAVSQYGSAVSGNGGEVLHNGGENPRNVGAVSRYDGAVSGNGGDVLRSGAEVIRQLLPGGSKKSQSRESESTSLRAQ